MSKTLRIAGFRPEIFEDGVKATDALFRDPLGPALVLLDQNSARAALIAPPRLLWAAVVVLMRAEFRAGSSWSAIAFL